MPTNHCEFTGNGGGVMSNELIRTPQQQLPHWYDAFCELCNWANWMVHDEHFIPHSPYTLTPADPNDPANRSDYETAKASIQGKKVAIPNKQSGWGVGFVLKNTPFRVIVANMMRSKVGEDGEPNIIERN